MGSRERGIMREGQSALPDVMTSYMGHVCNVVECTAMKQFCE